MGFFDFFHEQWILAFFSICSVYYLCRTLMVSARRVVMVCARGWPPSHLDADGDWKPETKAEEE